MRKSDLLRHNVSHLVVFQSLMKTGNVTASAGELHMSQPAVSRALTHLRTMFDDPLFVRAPGGVVATERARDLAPRVSDLVDELSDLISPQDFDLASTERNFRIATTDYGAGTVILDICRAFGEQAPKAALEIATISSDVFRDLAVGTFDLLLYVETPVPDTLRKQSLFQESYSCICRRDHPLASDLDGGLSLDEFLAWPHALITVFGGRSGLVDSMLKDLGKERHIALRLPYFSTAPLLVAQSDMLLTLPTRTARYFADLTGLHLLEAPVELESFGYYQVWHPRTEHDPAMIWLRQLIKEYSGLEAGGGNLPG